MMTRYLLTALCAALAAVCIPAAAAQTYGGCSSVASNRVATSTDAAKLKADVECGKRALVMVQSHLAAREKRLAELAAPPPAPPKPQAASVELPKIASNFDTKAFLVKSWGTGDIAPTGKPDAVGAFRFNCTPGPLGYIDFIVYPGVKTSHLHQFFGNTAIDENSTYQTLRTKGDSTCGNALNRSAYWLPAMLNGKGGVVIPDWLSIYYKRRPASDPECKRMGIACVKTPRGLRYVFGYDMLDHLAPHTGSAWWNCGGPTAKEGHYKDIVEAAVNCPVGNRLGVIINAPDCWNGKDLDSPDHRSHVAYASYGDWGYLRCPSTHPYVIPTFTLSTWYTVDDDLDRSGMWKPGMATWHLSSDVMPGMAPSRPGVTVHSDWFGAWDDDILDRWHANCIEKLLSCSGGDLGDGWQIAGAWVQPNTGPRVVPVPRK